MQQIFLVQVFLLKKNKFSNKKSLPRLLQHKTRDACNRITILDKIVEVTVAATVVCHYLIRDLLQFTNIVASLTSADRTRQREQESADVDG